MGASDPTIWGATDDYESRAGRLVYKPSATAAAILSQWSLVLFDNWP